MDQSTFARTSKNLPLCDLTEPNIVLGKNNTNFFSIMSNYKTQTDALY